ncbi:MAG: ATP-binding cassette domain-containing protein [Planctomycetota bacterium]|nr:ATP-binding cassette domain-containing protein [Planctomycetota bacterium]MCX8040501.1 ATP-binding cassette domain-containing protein [Planctomycetota bacterium]MDW8373507.1 ATP-binding cassette domain-containing protein [Planctomycetota bacterium]
MLSVCDLSMNFGQKVLFERVNLKFSPGNCYGVIGANGTGKSTFLKIIAGEIEPTLGEVVVEPGRRIGWLRQDIHGYEDETVISVALRGHREVWEIQQELDRLYAAGELDDAQTARLGELQERFEELDGYSQEPAAAQVLTDLGVEPELHQKPMREIDNARKVRVLLAQALFSKPDILLLDEPTNNLDIPAIVWLEQFLADYEGVIIVVSHDRHFLNRVCTHTLDIDYKTIRLFTGPYDVYQAQEALARAQRSREAGRIERQVARLKRFVERFKSNAARSKQATSRMKLIEQLSSQKVVPSSRIAPRIQFRIARPSGQDVVKLEGVSFAYPGGPAILRGLDTRIDRGERLAIVGRNGIGKTTICRLLVGELTPSRGAITWSSTVSRAYFPQEGGALFSKPELSILEWIRQFTATQDSNAMRAMLGRMLFSGDDVQKPVGVLSGGERVRCLLSMVMLQEANTLILDEPTAHLDMESIEALQEALEEFPGTLIFVSHDREFIDGIATRCWVLEDAEPGQPPRLTDWRGDYAAFRASRGME